TGATRLGRDRDRAARAKDSAELLEAFDGIRPETHGVDRHDLVQWRAEVGERVGGGEPEVDPADANRRGVSLSCDPEHDVRVVDAEHHAVRGETAQRRDGDSGTEA